MSKKTVILTIIPIFVLAILIIIFAVIIIEKIENTDTEEENCEEILGESEIGKKIKQLCTSVEYRPYDKTHIEYLSREEYPDKGITLKEEGFFSSGDWLCTYNSVDMEYIGKYIGTCTDEYDNKEYEIYEIKDVSSKYAVAYKDTTLDCYMGLINFQYEPESLMAYIDDANLLNSDVEIIMSYIEQSKNDSEEKLMMVTFTDEDGYLFEEFFRDRKYIGKIGRGWHLGEKIIVMSIYIYQKALKHVICMDVGLNGSIKKSSFRERTLLFEGSREATMDLLEYISQNYVGYKEKNTEQGQLPALGDKNEFLK